MARRGARSRVPTIAVVLAGLIITAGLVLLAQKAYADNEDRLVRQRVKEVTAVLTAAIPSIEAPLATTAEVVQADVDPELFGMALDSQTGPRPTDRFVAGALLAADDPEMLDNLGQPALVNRDEDEIRAFVRRTLSADGMTVLDLLDGETPRLGYGYAAADGASVVYAEAPLPADRTQAAQPDSAFANIDYALYLESPERARTLLLASTGALPLEGRHAEDATAFGDSRLIVVISPADDLGGSLLAALPWIAAAAGLTMTAGAAVATEVLQRRRADAEGLADSVTELYGEQRAASMTLQQSLLPRELPSIPGVDIAVRYSPGVAGTEVGGDWYEVVDLGSRTLLVVGDVSGRGLRAASVMAAVRHSVRAFASQGDSPQMILRKANEPNVIDLADHFATVLCVVLDRDQGTLEVATAGHPAPVLVDADGARFVDVRVGRPIGAPDGSTYEPVTTVVEPGTTVMLFTDGLFERRGEPIDVGLERVRQAADRSSGLDELVDGVFEALGAGTNEDDTAILAIRWTA